MRTLAALATCCLLLGVAGCGGSSSSSSSSSGQSASATSTPQSATTAVASTSTTSTTTLSSTSDGAASHRKKSQGTSTTTTTQSASSSSHGNTGGRSTSGGASGSTRAFGSLATLGSEATGTGRAGVLAGLHEYLTAIAVGDWAAACAELSTQVKRQLQLLLSHAKGLKGVHSCPEALGGLLGRTPPAVRRQLAQVSVIAMRIAGNHASVLYRSPQYQHATISMIRESGRWRAGVISPSTIG
jgi:hypothetical protein